MHRRRPPAVRPRVALAQVPAYQARHQKAPLQAGPSVAAPSLRTRRELKFTYYRIVVCD
jgi:hypothetical protein